MKKKNSQKKSTLRISSKTSVMVDNNVMHHGWKFHVWEKSGSLIIHENVSKNEEKKFAKKIYAKDFVQNLKIGRE